MPRPQFSLKTLLWLMLVVAAFFEGAKWQERRTLVLYQSAGVPPATSLWDELNRNR